jgi:acetyl-CoA carboxylase carboxyl transferase subunit beta
VELLCDEGSFIEMGSDLSSNDPLKFRNSKSYSERLVESRKKTGMNEAVLCGTARLEGLKISLGIFDFGFMGGSMGIVVGEKIATIFEIAANEGLPAITISSSGGARMQEGILSLMQMAKTLVSLNSLKRKGLPYISILSHPTTGGVTASFAMQGDIIIAEPGALIGFAGPRVIEQTIREKLPEGFQRSEFLLEHGMIDMILSRSELKTTVAKILRLLKR